MDKTKWKSWLWVMATAFAAAAQAQGLEQTPRDVVQFSAQATLEARQDLLSVTLRATHEGADAQVVQQQLKATLEAALADARARAQAGAMEVRSGNFTLTPRSARDGRIAAWVGTAELMLSGRDFERVAGSAGRINGMVVAGVSYGLSREQREKLESQAQVQAIERFRTRAGDIARAFGYGGYALREVNVSAQEQGAVMRPRMLAAAEAFSSRADAPLPVEAGLATVQVTVSGSVQLTR